MTLNGTNQANFVDVNGIHFETVVPQRNITLPARGSKTQVRFDFGIRITNHTPEMQRFLLFFIRPQFLYADGTIVGEPAGPNYNKTAKPKRSDFQDLKPGEMMTCFRHGYFQRFKRQVGFLFLGNDNGGWCFEGFQPTSYAIRLIYHNHYSVWEDATDLGDPERFEAAEKRRSFVQTVGREVMKIEGVWIGEVTTPLVEFNLN